jgi:uncharacterized protein YkwD
MLSLSVTLAIGLLFAVLPGGAGATQPARHVEIKVAQPAKVQTAVWVTSRAARPATIQTIGWGRWRTNRWAYMPMVQPRKSQPAKPKAAPPATAQTKQPAKAQAAAPPKPAPAQPAKPAPANSVAAKPVQPESTLTPAQQIQLHAVEMGVIENTNRQRARYGLRPLRVDFGLIHSARRHTQWMTRNHVLQHTSAGVAENIAMGQSSPTEVLNAWMNSDGHRANILNSSYTRIGVAAYHTPQGTIFWCQQFMR